MQPQILFSNLKLHTASYASLSFLEVRRKCYFSITPPMLFVLHNMTCIYPSMLIYCSILYTMFCISISQWLRLLSLQPCFYSYCKMPWILYLTVRYNKITNSILDSRNLQVFHPTFCPKMHSSVAVIT